MLPEQLQSDPKILFMLFLILRINKNSIKENKDKLVQIPAENTIHEEMNVVGAFVRPKGTTTNS